jgi:predicted Rossmann fold nucleotide-binding protein DprA/Smf involved in DNA uptake
LNNIQDINLLSDSNKDELIITLLKQNADLIKGQQDIFMKLSETNTNSPNHTNNIHNSMNNNKTFNLQFFLNETCKDAMNITEFVNNMKLELDDLENTGRTGYVEGISNIVIKNLNKLEQHLRPLHCGDFKREVLYIKHNNEWTKEGDNKPILTKAIKTIANENIKQISKWKDKYPDCIKSDSKKNDLYLKIVSNSMNGLTKEEGEKNINKIISNVVKKVVIEK